MIVKAWLERVPNIAKDYEPCKQWNMDELGLFVATFLYKGLVEKNKSSRGGKQSKKRMTIAVFVAADSSKPCNPLAIWQNQLPRCFRKLTVPICPAGLHYFANAKSWMNTEIMEHILGRHDRKLKLENCYVILFPENAPSVTQRPFKTHWNTSNWYFCQKIQPLNCHLQMQGLFAIPKPSTENACLDMLYLF